VERFLGHVVVGFRANVSGPEKNDCPEDHFNKDAPDIPSHMIQVAVTSSLVAFY
jgi:hypothetical protein